MDINESLDHILCAADTLGKLFFEHFLDAHPEMRPHFQNADYARLHALLATALMVIARHYIDPEPAVEEYLQYLGRKHCEMGIRGNDYDKWGESMMASLARFHGDQWTPHLRDQWQEAIGKATKLLLDGYERDAAA